MSYISIILTPCWKVISEALSGIHVHHLLQNHPARNHQHHQDHRHKWPKFDHFWTSPGVSDWPPAWRRPQHHKGCSWSKLDKTWKAGLRGGRPKSRGLSAVRFQFSPEIWSEHPFATHFNTISQEISDLSKTSFSKWPSRKPKKVPLHISLQTHFTMKLNPRLCSGPPYGRTTNVISPVDTHPP